MHFNELARTHYFHEVERRRDLNSALSIPLGVLTALFAALGAILGSLSFPFSPEELTTLVIASLAVLAGGVSISYAIRSYIGYSYGHVASMGLLASWRDQLTSAGVTAADADRKVYELAIEQYASAAELNSQNNDRKSGLIHNAGEWLTGCLILVVAAAIRYTISRMKQQQALQGECGKSSIHVTKAIGSKCERD